MAVEITAVHTSSWGIASAVEHAAAPSFKAGKASWVLASKSANSPIHLAGQKGEEMGGEPFCIAHMVAHQFLNQTKIIKKNGNTMICCFILIDAPGT